MSRPLPFEGIRIVDLSMFMSGPLVTLIAADLGADVIKVESIQRIDGWRGSSVPGPEGLPAWEGSPAYNWINRNKRGITLNLGDPRGADVLRRLVAISDAVVENYTPRVMENFGLTYADLVKVNPSLVMLSMPGFGGTGPWRDYAAFAWNTEQMSGLAHLTGYEGEQPLFSGSTGGDPLAGLIGAVALFSALNHRRRTGEGQHIDLSQVEAGTLFVGGSVVEAALTGASPTRHGNWRPDMAPHNTYPCRDGRWLAIACRDDADWCKLATVIGQPALAAEGQPFATTAGRVAGHKELDAVIAAWTTARDVFEAAALAKDAGVPAAPVLNGENLRNEPHLAAREFFIPQDRPYVGVKHYPGQPFRMSGVPPREHARSPLLGEHTAEVLAEYLGLGSDDLAALAAADVTGTVPLAGRQAV